MFSSRAARVGNAHPPAGKRSRKPPIRQARGTREHPWAYEVGLPDFPFSPNTVLAFVEEKVAPPNEVSVGPQKAEPLGEGKSEPFRERVRDRTTTAPGRSAQQRRSEKCLGTREVPWNPDTPWARASRSVSDQLCPSRMVSAEISCQAGTMFKTALGMVPGRVARQRPGIKVLLMTPRFARFS
jgi:hypothetical protein